MSEESVSVIRALRDEIESRREDGLGDPGEIHVSPFVFRLVETELKDIMTDSYREDADIMAYGVDVKKDPELTAVRFDDD